ncbi:MAG: succinylglutamate desuccinylase/aspartoacylase family protein [Reichenbachiella sp.]|uniref:succinylglutamate desuccinylase/aspartoacylase family protein n=1 Tax=Reichenbachiella sp. TaxID=2184521 RepID=UPI003266CFB4
MIKEMQIAGQTILPGEEKQINANIAQLPTRTPIDIPIIVSRSEKEGPTLLLMAGMHGDEINGVEIVRRMIVNQYNRPLIGSVICIPILNIHGFIHFSRQVPDGKDINRSFPGSLTGSLASQIAYHLKKEILPQIDYGLDFHTGGARINNYPQIRAMLDNKVNFDLAKAFAPRFIIDSKFREKSLRKEADKLNKSILVYEGGESLRLRKNAIEEGIFGALRVMKFLGMRSEAPLSSYEPIFLKTSSWMRARAAGIYHSVVRTGEEVRKGQKLGLITGPFGEFEKPVMSHTSGHVIAVNNSPVVNRGDALMHIGVIK